MKNLDLVPFFSLFSRSRRSQIIHANIFAWLTKRISLSTTNLRDANTFSLYSRIPNPIWSRRPLRLALNGFIRYFHVPLEHINIGGDSVVIPSVRRVQVFFRVTTSSIYQQKRRFGNHIHLFVVSKPYYMSIFFLPPLRHHRSWKASCRTLFVYFPLQDNLPSIWQTKRYGDGFVVDELMVILAIGSDIIIIVLQVRSL